MRGKATTVFNGSGKAKIDFDGKCGVDFRLHDLRRTFATNLAALGTPVQVTEKMLNHVTGAISGVAAIYTATVILTRCTRRSKCGRQN